MKGWVYIISNKAMPGLVKVGISEKDPELRAQELEGPGVPHPYIVEYEMLVEGPDDVEEQAHHFLSTYREGKGWFHCSAEEAVLGIQRAAAGKPIIETLKKADREKAEKIRPGKEMAEEKQRRETEEYWRKEGRIKKEAELLRQEDQITQEYYGKLLEIRGPRLGPIAYFWRYLLVVIVAFVGNVYLFRYDVLPPSVFPYMTALALVLSGFIVWRWSRWSNARKEKSEKYLTLIKERDEKLETLREERRSLYE